MAGSAGQFYDGKSARAHVVTVELEADAVRISGPALGDDRRWRLDAIEAVEPPKPGVPLRLRYTPAPGERLVIADTAFIAKLLERTPALERTVHPRSVLKFAVITVLGLMVAAGLGYLLLTVLPPVIVKMMPDAWRDRLGEQAVRQFLGSYPECSGSTGKAALGSLVARLTASEPGQAPTISVEVRKLPVINAFTLPGGKVVLSGSLIAAATTPDEVAGVLAHELGHAHHQDPEVALVRLTGLQLLISLASGSDGGNVLSNIVGLAAFLRYSRAAEERADDYAQELLQAARIDPLGLKRFFERIEDKDRSASAFGTLGNIFSTHPGTEARIARIKPLAGGPGRPALDQRQWQDLRRICR
jgi:Zn-dependent protease with chaperone function